MQQKAKGVILPQPGPTPETFSRRYKLKDMGSGKLLTRFGIRTLFHSKKNPACGLSDIAHILGVATTTISSATRHLTKTWAPRTTSPCAQVVDKELQASRIKNSAQAIRSQRRA